MTVLDQFFEKDIRALSKIISFIENREDGYRELLGKLYQKNGSSVRIGVTGPPGAGKSTLVNALIHQFLDQGKSVGVLAVDPTSPFTGGALLGDRVRIHDFPPGSNVYFRSMATRGASGGLSAAVNNATVAMDAFGFDIVLIETVGVGQVELDVIDACDSVVVAVVPESGDAVQAMKAGLMEIADIFVVNKSDRPGADRLVQSLKQMLDTKKKSGSDWNIPIIETVAVENKNIDRLYNNLTEHIELIKSSGQFDSKREKQISKKIVNILKNRFEKEFLDKLDFESGLNDAITRILEGKSNPYSESDQLYNEFIK